FAEAAFLRRRPLGINAVHLANDALAIKALQESDIVGLALLKELVEIGEVARLIVVDTPPQFITAMLEKVIEDAAAPVFIRIGRARIFRALCVDGAVGAPMEGAAFVNGMKRVDDSGSDGDIEACR